MNIKAMIGALSLLAVCGVPTTAQTLPPAKGELSAGQPRSYQVGDKWVWQNEGNDRQFTHEIVAIDGPLATIRSGRCTFSTRLDGYSPTLAYENCPWGPWGKVQAERSGEIFPLRIGKTESWEYAGGTGQRTWSGVRDCEVKGTTHLTVPAGSFDAYHVLCIERWWRIQIFFAPELGTNVAFIRTPLGRGTFRHSKLVRFIPAG